MKKNYYKFLKIMTKNFKTFAKNYFALYLLISIVYFIFVIWNFDFE